VSEETARPQDLGRPHRRARPGPTPETARILERYRAAMRAELERLLEEIGARRPGLLPDVPGELVIPPPERAKLWELAIKLGRELGAPGLAELEEEPAPASTSTSPRRSSTPRAPRLSARERRSLGG
jgi:hypothetical protein